MFPLLPWGGFPGGSDHKEFTHNAGDPGSIPGSGKFQGEWNDHPLQYSCQNSMDRGAWWVIVHEITKSQTGLRDLLSLSLSLSFLIALRAWNPGRCGVGENRLSQRCPRIGAEDGVWYLCFESQHWKSAVPSGLHELSGKTGKGWDWKRIGSRDLQTLQGEGGAKRRLCQPSSLLPHSAQGCVFGLYLFSR